MIPIAIALWLNHMGCIIETFQNYSGTIAQMIMIHPMINIWFYMIFFSPTGNFFTLLEWKILRNALSGSREAFALVSYIWETFIKLLQWSLLELSNFLYCTRYCTNIFHQAFSSREVMSPPADMGRMGHSMHRAVGGILFNGFLGELYRWHNQWLLNRCNFLFGDRPTRP